MSQPKYIQVMERLRSDISEREPHTPILSEREISQKLNMSRMTVRRAIDELCREGVLYRDGNRGTFVAASHPDTPHHVSNERQRVLFLDSIYDSGNVKPVQKAFHLEENGRLFRMVRLILDGDTPLRIEEIYTLPETALDKDLEELGTFFDLDAWRQSGNSRYVLKPVIVPTKYAKLLQLKQGIPILCREELIRRKDGTLFLYVYSYLNPDTSPWDNLPEEL